MGPDVLATALGTVNTLLAAGIWFKLGRLEGEVDADHANRRLDGVEKRLSRLEEKAMGQ